MDIVYTFRHDRRSLNSQLKYSLRSIEKHISGVDRVFVIGHNPRLDGIIHIEAKDLFGPARNISTKLMAIADHPDVSENFLYMADDYFMMKDYDIEKYPAYVNSTLQELFRTQSNAYRAMIKNTIKALEGQGRRTYNFNIHVPIIYNKTKLRHIGRLYDMNNRLGYLIKSLYMNTFQPLECQQIKDCKIRTNFKLDDMRTRIGTRNCWSSGKEWVCPNIITLLKQLYPLKSKYE